MESETKNSDDYLTQGSDHYAAGRLADALAVWEEGLRVTPDSADLHYNVGLGLSHSGLPVEATQHWREAIRIRPDFYSPHYALLVQVMERIQASKRKALWHEARSLCRQTLALDAVKPDHRAYLLRLLGQAEWKLGNRAEGLSAMEAAVAADPDNQPGYEHLGSMQAKTGMPWAALRTAFTLARLPNFDDTRYQKDFIRIWLVLVVGVLTGGALLAWRLARRR